MKNSRGYTLSHTTASPEPAAARKRRFNSVKNEMKFKISIALCTEAAAKFYRQELISVKCCLVVQLNLNISLLLLAFLSSAQNLLEPKAIFNAIWCFVGLATDGAENP